MQQSSQNYVNLVFIAASSETNKISGFIVETVRPTALSK